MQLDPIRSILAPFLFGFILALIFMFIALYFATRIVTNRVITPREAFIGAIITVIVYEIVKLILFFIYPMLGDWIALALAAVVLLVLLLKYYDLGFFSTIALVMLSLAIIFTISTFRTAIFFILLSIP